MIGSFLLADEGAGGPDRPLRSSWFLSVPSPRDTAADANAVTLTVEQAVSRAKANQPLIRQALAAVEAARARVGEAQSSYYPMVSGTASYNRLSDESFAISSVLPPFLSSQVPSQYQALLSAPFSLVPDNNWDFNIGLNQVITQFGKRDVQVKLAQSGLASARIGVDQVTTAISYQAVQVFYTALFLQEQGKALDEQYQNLQEHLRVIQVREDTGSATRLEDLGTQVRMAALQSQRTDVESQFQKQKIALRQLTGLAPVRPDRAERQFRSRRRARRRRVAGGIGAAEEDRCAPGSRGRERRGPQPAAGVARALAHRFGPRLRGIQEWRAA